MTSIESFYTQMPQLAFDETEIDMAILAEAVGHEKLFKIIDSIVKFTELPE